ncbi:MAG: hypothetical protein ACFFEJ_09250 [Candidatus Thorarchaeota archaeon]
MAIGIIHILFMADAAIMTVCAMLIFRRYFEQRNILTLVFSVFLLTFALMCYSYFGRGLFEMNTDGSVLLYRISILFTLLAPFLLAVFGLYPKILEGAQSSSGNAKITIILCLVVTLISLVLAFLGDVTYRYAVESMDIYQLTFGAIPYLGILIGPVLIAILDAGIFLLMYKRETDPFYKMRAMLLFIGWVFAIVGQLSLLSPSVMLLQPLLFALGTVIMALAILRRPNQEHL